MGIKKRDSHKLYYKERKLNTGDKIVYVITHKECNLPKLENYSPLLVGAKNKEPELRQKYQCDDEGDNISEKNDSYCELTGLYWMWKNVDTEYIGLVHYRRFFADVHFFGKMNGMYMAVNREKAYKILDIDDMMQILASHDFIVKKSRYYKNGVRNALLNVISETDIHRLEQLIKLEYPEYFSTMQQCLKENHFIHCNMFFGKKEIINHYCEWMFSVLERMDELQIKETGKRYCNREQGYFGELLLSVWFEKNRVDYIFVDVVNTMGCEMSDCIVDISDLINKFTKRLKRIMNYKKD